MQYTTTTPSRWYNHHQIPWPHDSPHTTTDPAPHRRCCYFPSWGAERANTLWLLHRRYGGGGDGGSGGGFGGLGGLGGASRVRFAGYGYGYGCSGIGSGGVISSTVYPRLQQQLPVRRRGSSVFVGDVLWGCEIEPGPFGSSFGSSPDLRLGRSGLVWPSQGHERGGEGGGGGGGVGKGGENEYLYTNGGGAGSEFRIDPRDFEGVAAAAMVVDEADGGEMAGLSGVEEDKEDEDEGDDVGGFTADERYHHHHHHHHHHDEGIYIIAGDVLEHELDPFDTNVDDDTDLMENGRYSYQRGRYRRPLPGRSAAQQGEHSDSAPLQNQHERLRFRSLWQKVRSRVSWHHGHTQGHGHHRRHLGRRSVPPPPHDDDVAYPFAVSPHSHDLDLSPLSSADDDDDYEGVRAWTDRPVLSEFGIFPHSVDEIPQEFRYDDEDGLGIDTRLDHGDSIEREMWDELRHAEMRVEEDCQQLRASQQILQQRVAALREAQAAAAALLQQQRGGRPFSHTTGSGHMGWEADDEDGDGELYSSYPHDGEVHQHQHQHQHQHEYVTAWCHDCCRHVNCCCTRCQHHASITRNHHWETSHASQPHSPHKPHNNNKEAPSTPSASLTNWTAAWQSYQQHWRSLSQTDPQIPYPTPPPHHSSGLLLTHHLPFPHDSPTHNNTPDRDIDNDNDITLETNACNFYLLSTGLIPPYHHHSSDQDQDQDQNQNPNHVPDLSIAPLEKIVELARRLKGEKVNWHPDSLGRRTGEKKKVRKDEIDDEGDKDDEGDGKKGKGGSEMNNKDDDDDDDGGEESKGEEMKESGSGSNVNHELASDPRAKAVWRAVMKLAEECKRELDGRQSAQWMVEEEEE